MPKYIVAFSGELEIETDTSESASQKAHTWRRFVLHEVVQVNYDRLGVRRMSIKPMTDIVEVTQEYLQSHPPRMIIRRENPATDIDKTSDNDL